MSIDEPNKIDFVALEKDQSSVLLVVTDHHDWEAEEGEHLLLLQDKLNSYLHFIEGGELVKRMPSAATLPVKIRIAGKYPLSAEASRFFELAKGRVEEAGVSLEFVLFNPEKKS